MRSVRPKWVDELKIGIASPAADSLPEREQGRRRCGSASSSQNRDAGTIDDDQHANDDNDDDDYDDYDDNGL